MRQQKLDETAVVGATAKNSELPAVANLNKVRDIDGDLSIKQFSLHNIDSDGVPVDDETRHSFELYSSAADENYNYTKSSSKRAASDIRPSLGNNNNQSDGTIPPPLDSTTDISELLSFKTGEDSEYLDMERYIDSENNTYHGERFARPTEGVCSQNLGKSRRERYGTQTSLRENWKKITEPILTLQLQQQQQSTAVVPSSAKQQLSPMTTSSISDLMTSSYVTSMMTSTDDGSSSLISTDDNLWETGDAAFASLGGGERDSMGASVYAASSVSAFSDSDFCDVTNRGNYFEQSNAAIHSHFSNVNKIGSVPMECSYSEEFTRGECFDRNDVTPTSFLRYDQNDVTPSGSDDDFAQGNGSMAHYNDVVWKSNRKKVLARKRVHGNDSENNNSKEYVSYREARGSSDNFEKDRFDFVKPASTNKKDSATKFHLNPVNSPVQRSSRLNIERTAPSLTYEKGSFKDDLKRNNYVDMWRMNSASPDATRYDSQFYRDGVSVVKKQTASYLKRNDASLIDSGLFEDQQQEPEGYRSIDDTKRSLARISSGLARNVTVLRERKQLMSDVFGPSLAEERIRVRELKRFQREALEARKRVLLETLADLKHSLAAQAQRLQGAYDTVLSRQYAVMKSSQIGGR